MAAGIVLFADDDAAFTRQLARSFVRLNPSLVVQFANDVATCLARVNAEPIDVAVIDLSIEPNIGPESGLRLIEQILELSPSTRVIVLTGHELDQYGIQALDRGAASFLSKPVDIDHLSALTRDGVVCAQIRRVYNKLAEQSRSHYQFAGLKSRSPEMQRVIETVMFAASTRSPVIILGETGTGKGVVAEAIHRASNSINSGKFIRFQPGFGSHDLTASELFGHKRGSFTGAAEDRKGLIEEASGGTLFIDEIDELSHATQISLLHVLQEKRFRPLGSNREIFSDFRLLSATNRDISQVLENGKLRKDLFHRIAHITISIPPLRERAEDITDLAEEFLQTIVTREKYGPQGISATALRRLVTYSWPGNVRELLATMEAAVAMATFKNHRWVEKDDLSLPRRGDNYQAASEGRSFREQVDHYELLLIDKALKQHKNNKTLAAKSLQLERSTLLRILKRNLKQ